MCQDDKYARIPEKDREYVKRFTEPGPGMLEKEALMHLAARELIQIYGLEYLLDCQSHSCRGTSYLPDGRFMYFAGLKSQKQLPDHPADRKGWVVSATVYLDSYTGKLLDIQYTKE